MMNFALNMVTFVLGIEVQELDQRKISRMPAPLLDRAVVDKWMAHVQIARFGEPAPVNIVNAVEGACTADSFAAGVAIEGQNMAPLMVSFYMQMKVLMIENEDSDDRK